MRSNLIAGRTVVAVRGRHTWQRCRFTAVIASLVVTLCCGRIRAQKPVSEYQVKAAFLFNFAKFIDWPLGSFAGPQSPFSICILGADPFGQAIDDTLRGQTIRGRAVVVQRVREAAQLRRCHVAFIGVSEAAHLQAVLQATRGASVLLVGESPGFAAAGGMIQFQMQNNRIRFSINPDAAERAGLRVSSKLLSLATVVRDSPENGTGT